MMMGQQGKQSTHRELALGCGNMDSPQQMNIHSSGGKCCGGKTRKEESVAGLGRMPWAGGVIYCERPETV